MKKILSICATIIIAASITYGLTTLGSDNEYMIRLAFIGCALAIASFSTIFIAQETYPEEKIKNHVAIGFLGIVFSICIVLGVYVNGPYWLLITLMIGMLWLSPNPATVYYSAILLGASGMLLFSVIDQRGYTLSPCIHFGCVVIFALSTWIRVYISSKNSRT